MASITDIVSAMQNWVSATSAMSKQMTGSFTNISGKIAANTAAITALTSAVTALTSGTVTTIAGNSGAFTLNGTSGITNTVNDIKLSQGSTSQFGAVKVDGTTITAASGIITAVVPAVSLTSIQSALGADVSLTNVSSYFDGPSVAQGSSGTWFVSGLVTVLDPGTSPASIDCKLWDGTNVIASTLMRTTNALGGFPVTLSGVITSPSSNLRISCKDVTATTGKILFNASGNSKDSTICAVRIA